jgi:hypothetical protein
MLLLEKVRKISTGSASRVEDATVLGEKSQEFFNEVLMSSIVVKAVFFAVKRCIAIILQYTFTSHLF